MLIPLSSLNIKLHRRLTLLCVPIFIWNVSLVYADEQELKFSYDVLGRLTFVHDDVNGNRDYDYDSAGNRCSVSIGAANNDIKTCEDYKIVVPFIPSGSSCNWSSSHSYSSGNPGGSYYEYPVIGPCIHSIKMVTSITGGSTTTTYR